MPLIVVNTNAPEVRRQLNQLGRKIEHVIITRSLNRTITQIKTEASKRAYEELNLKEKRINRDLKVHRARSGQHSAEVVVAAKATPLIEYGAKQLKRGVSFKVKRKGKRKKLRHAFIATMASGHRGVFERRTKGGEPVGRLPIDELQSTALVQFFDDRIIAPIAARARDRFGRELDQQIAFEVGKL